MRAGDVDTGSLLLLVGGISAVVGYVASGLRANRLGLSDVQKAVRDQTAALVSTLQARVDALAQENVALRQRVDALTSENTAQARRIDHLEKVVADKAIEGLRS